LFKNCGSFFKFQWETQILSFLSKLLGPKQTMILTVLSVKMINPRCQRLHRELDERLVHRDAMTVHQEHPESVLRHPNLAILGLHGALNKGDWVAVCETQKLVEPSTAARGLLLLRQ
jgi:hypothetical protein